MISITTMSRGVTNQGGLTFRQDMSRSVSREAYSMTFKRNAMHCILAYCIPRSVSVCIRPFQCLIGGPHENG